jgi:hypothetical protein
MWWGGEKSYSVHMKSLKERRNLGDLSLGGRIMSLEEIIWQDMKGLNLN